MSITRREAEVAALVAEGLSNPAIAAVLCVSRRTVASHVAHILTKLDYSSRTQIAAWITRQRITGGTTPNESQRGREARAPEGQVIPAPDREASP